MIHFLIDQLPMHVVSMFPTKDFFNECFTRGVGVKTGFIKSTGKFYNKLGVYFMDEADKNLVRCSQIL